MNIEKIPYNLTTNADIVRHDFNVCIGTELYNFYVLEMRFKETNTIEFWCGEYSIGIIQFMFGIKNDDLGKEIRHKYLYTEIKLLNGYFTTYLDRFYN